MYAAAALDPVELIRAVLPWAFVGLSVLGLGLTLNALAPVRRNKALLLPSFLAGTVVVGLAAFFVGRHVVVAAGFVAVGGLDSWVGWVGLAVAAGSVVGLAVLVRQGLGAAAIVRETLEPLLGHRPRPVGRWWRLLVPFPLRVRGSRVSRNVEFARVAGQRLRLDVYRAANRPEGELAPAVIHIHGGGWTVGDKREQGVPLMAVVSDRGFVGFNVNYRLSPGATWPEHLVDVKRAIAWVRAHAEEYGVDPSFIAIAGGSAGGHLATMAALTAGDPALQPGFEDADTSVAAVASFYAIYDLTNASGRHVPGFLDTLVGPLVIKAFYDDEPERFEAASPIHVIRETERAAVPPFFVIHGDRDTLAPLDDARDFVTALADVSDRPVLFAEVRGAQHSFDFFVSPRSLPILEGVCEFFEHVVGSGRER